MFGIYSLFRHKSNPEINSGERFIDDTDYISQNAMIERMLSAGFVPPIPNEFFDDEVNKDDFDIPKDAEVRSYDADLTRVDVYASQLFDTVSSSDGEVGRGIEPADQSGSSPAGEVAEATS